jgi:hypothetical protein
MPADSVEIDDDETLIRRFFDRPEFYIHGNLAGTIFMRRPGQIDAKTSVYARRIMLHDLEWCASSVPKPMRPFGVVARIPRVGVGNERAGVINEPKPNAPSHTEILGLTDSLCDHLAENGEIITDLPTCFPLQAA